MEKLPILLITYKRLDTTINVLKSIKEYQPTEIFLFSDGPKSSKDMSRILQVRDFLKDSINWNCKIYQRYSDKNLGCKYGPQNAITWFFENVEKGIILEDDCVPSQDFYKFCDYLLNKYRNDWRVFNISGTKITPDGYIPTEDYFFSRIAYNWGWATWSDRWRWHIENLDKQENYFSRPEVVNAFSEKSHYENFRTFVSNSLNDKLDAWDYQWRFSIILNNALSIMPKNNLIKYVGFGEDSTHTSNQEDKTIPQITEPINWPMLEPTIVLTNKYIDLYILDDVYNWKSLRKKFKLRHIINVIKARLNL